MNADNFQGTPLTSETASHRHVDAESFRPGLDRRGLVGRIGAGAMGAAVLGAIATGGVAMSSTPAQAALTDGDILNFALNLEYLEAEFYLRAATGQGLQNADRTGTCNVGTVTGGSQVPFVSSSIAQYAQIIASDELQHVRFLREVLGSSAVAEPSIDLSASFTNLAIAAGLIVAGQTFNPFSSDVAFLLGAFIFEDVGVTAYAGAASSIVNPTYLTAAAGILATEAYHSGAIRTLLADLGAGQAANAISALRATLSGAADDQGILIPGLQYNFRSVDANALAFRRTTSQVLNVVYGGGAASNYLFFPGHLNGNIS